jgi:DNA repair exonuclease SbcCD ATPase subunit
VIWFVALGLKQTLKRRCDSHCIRTRQEGVFKFIRHHVPVTIFLCFIDWSVAAGGAWFFQEQKIKALGQQVLNQKDVHAAEVKGFQAATAADAALASQKLDAAAAAHKVLEEHYESLRSSSQRREAEAEERIKALNQELLLTRETAAQLEPTKVRIGVLENALTSERGRVAALEQTADVSNKRAEDFQKRLDQAIAELSQLRLRSEERERELLEKITKLEQTIQANATLVETAETQVNQANETLNAYRQQAETRLTNLQRQLAAAEAKAALVQKEFMSAVGVLPDKPSAPSRSASVGDDKRLAELEAKILQIEAEARKKAREDGYKIAELEYRLSEAKEALNKPSDS